MAARAAAGHPSTVNPSLDRLSTKGSKPLRSNGRVEELAPIRRSWAGLPAIGRDVELTTSELTPFLPSVAFRDQQLRSSAHFNQWPRHKAKIGAEVAKESMRNEKITKKSLGAKSSAYAYAPKTDVRTHCHDLGGTSRLELDPMRTHLKVLYVRTSDQI
ncbi:hypothetical protein PIB30_085444 [Stylosanthes scabra]|uniref:Uncharacterized protein n=1 Tax=Stylosanthes scabra TaxID=79078 RepID=A0ABU6UVF5_9FABA|nr:hypothetical protein [Stylosanthes scabra]